jgi:hypothetical protein
MYLELATVQLYHYVYFDREEWRAGNTEYDFCWHAALRQKRYAVRLLSRNPDEREIG